MKESSITDESTPGWVQPPITPTVKVAQNESKNKCIVCGEDYELFTKYYDSDDKPYPVCIHCGRESHESLIERVIWNIKQGIEQVKKES